MELNYAYNDRIYKIKTEKQKDTYLITLNNTTYTVKASEIKPGFLRLTIDDKVIKAVISEGSKSKFVFLDGNIFTLKSSLSKTKKIEKKDDLSSPISGKVVSIKAKEGDSVKKGDVIMVIEAMKMEYFIKAPFDGFVKKIHFNVDEQIDKGVKPVDIDKRGE